MRFHVAGKKYFIDSIMKYCYPNETNKIVDDYGVLSQYMGKYYSRDEIDAIICELITEHPYVSGSFRLEMSVMYIERFNTGIDGCMGYYHILDFQNFDYKRQKCGDTAIKFEK